MFLWDLAIVCLSGHKRSCDSLECFIKGFVVQEYPIVVVVPVETILDLTDRPRDFPDI